MAPSSPRQFCDLTITTGACNQLKTDTVSPIAPSRVLTQFDGTGRRSKVAQRGKTDEHERLVTGAGPAADPPAINHRTRAAVNVNPYIVRWQRRQNSKDHEPGTTVYKVARLIHVQARVNYKSTHRIVRRRQPLRRPHTEPVGYKASWLQGNACQCVQ